MELTSVLMIIGFSLLIILATGFITRKSKSADQFFVGDRQIGTWIGAFTSAAAWTWAPALFVSSQMAYTKGLPGVLWFSIPNALALVMFAFFAKKREKLRNKDILYLNTSDTNMEHAINYYMI